MPPARPCGCRQRIPLQNVLALHFWVGPSLHKQLAAPATAKWHARRGDKSVHVRALRPADASCRLPACAVGPAQESNSLFDHRVQLLYTPPGSDIVFGATRTRQLIVWQHSRFGAYRCAAWRRGRPGHVRAGTLHLLCCRSASMQPLQAGCSSGTFQACRPACAGLCACRMWSKVLSCNQH